MESTEVLLFEIAVSIHETVSEKFPEIVSLKAPQVEAITQYILKKDVFAVLPTGMGKSLIFQTVPDICSRLNKRGFQYPENPILLVICPLVSLVESHMEELKARQISAAYLSGEEVDESGIKAGKYSVVFSTRRSKNVNTSWQKSAGASWRSTTREKTGLTKFPNKATNVGVNKKTIGSGIIASFRQRFLLVTYVVK